MNDLSEILESAAAGTVRVIYCKHLDSKSRKWILTPHAHRYMELIYFLSGGASIEAEGENFSTSLCSAVGYFPGTVHCEKIDMELRQEAICLWLDIGTVPNLRKAFSVLDKTGELRWLFEKIELYYKSTGSSGENLARCYAEALLLSLGQALRCSHTEGSLADTVLSYIEQNITRPITPAMLARLNGVSPSYLHRIFRKRTGLPPGKYIHALKIHLAKDLLLETDLPVSRIAEQLGFSDPLYFSRIFKSFAGISPSEYRG